MEVIGGEPAGAVRSRRVRSSAGACDKGGTTSRLVLLSTRREGRAYLPVRGLVEDKQDVALLLALVLEESGERGPGGILTPTREVVVVKVTEVTRPDMRVQAMSEARALGSVPAGSQVCPVVDYLQDATHFYLVMPYLEGGDLFERVSASASAGLPAPEARRYFRQVLSGLLDLKRTGIAHGDLSLENVMLTRRLGAPRAQANNDMFNHEEAPLDAYIIDLGSSCVAGPGSICPPGWYLYRGKLGYAPPEVVGRDAMLPIDPFAVDVWSLSICLYALLVGRPLYLSLQDSAFKVLCEGQAQELIEHYANFGLVLDPLAQDLVCSMLRVSPSERPTLEEIAAHPWVVGAAE